jgi:4-diphosphocytidyl-2-C-methyl-D-erythritol kinase
MRTHGVFVKKAIPAFAGLGGGSSDAATYLKMCNEVLHLGLSLSELARVGLKVGADVPFFIYGYKSANVSGIGEIVEEFEEELLELETFTPKIEISTPKVYKSYRENFYAPLEAEKILEFKNAKSADILKNFSANEANDLFQPALLEYKELKNHYQYAWHFSGSGSSFFKVKEEK